MMCYINTYFTLHYALTVADNSSTHTSTHNGSNYHPGKLGLVGCHLETDSVFAAKFSYIIHSK